jgi:hypothetical protein
MDQLSFKDIDDSFREANLIAENRNLRPRDFADWVIVDVCGRETDWKERFKKYLKAETP